MSRRRNPVELTSFFKMRPHAGAIIQGGYKFPSIRGVVYFYETSTGVIVRAEVSGLPCGVGCDSPIFGFHIHEGLSCYGGGESPFSEAMGHFKSNMCPHPYHAGDMPPLLGVGGRAFSVFLTGRFTLEEIIGRTVVIHGGRDDFTTDPSGDSGERIACGEIRELRGIR